MVSKMVFNVAILCVCVLGLARGKNFGLSVEDVKKHEDPMLDSKPGLFNSGWRQIYDEEHLERQPKFKMAAQQPEKELNYEIRDYEAAWYVSSYTPCLNQTESAAQGYLRLIRYMAGVNSQHRRFPLTYPIVSKIELGFGEVTKNVDDVIVTREKIQHLDEIIRALHEIKENVEKSQKQLREDSKKEQISRKTCVDRFSQYFYLPLEVSSIPPNTSDVTITTEIVPAKRYYVRTYHGKFSKESQAKCNHEAGVFALDLALSGVKNYRMRYYCAVYEPGNADVNALFEVWFEAI